MNDNYQPEFEDFFGPLPEEPIENPSITIEDAYKFGFLQAGVGLYVSGWSTLYGLDEYPPNRKVYSIERKEYPHRENPIRYELRVDGMEGVMLPNERVHIACDSPASRILVHLMRTLATEAGNMRDFINEFAPRRYEHWLKEVEADLET